MRRLFRMLAASAALLLCLQAAHAQDTSAQESRRAALLREIAQLERQIQENSTRSSNALEALTLVRKQVATRRSLVEESDAQIRALRDTIAALQAAAERLQERLETMELYFRRLVRNAYKNRDSRIWYSYLLSSKDLGQASRRFVYLRDLSSQMNTQARKIKDLRAGLAAELEQLAGLKREAEEIRAAHAQELQSLQAEERRADQLVAQLQKDKGTYQRQIASRRKQVEALNREIERIIAQALEEARKKELAAQQEKNKQSSGKSTRPVDIKLSGEFAANKGKLPWPADGPVVEKFGTHNHPVYTTLVMPANNGVNIGLSKGDPVQAVFDGEVKRIIVMPGYGRCVLVQHGSYFSFYCKLGDVSVKSGDSVKTGQTLGHVDTIDGQTQLHFEVWQEKTPENPELWLRPKP